MRTEGPKGEKRIWEEVLPGFEGGGVRVQRDEPLDMKKKHTPVRERGGG